MKKINIKEDTDEFYWQLVNSLKYVLLVILLASGLQLLLTKFNLSFNKEILLILIITKASSIVILAFRQLTKIIGKSHLLSHILVLFGLLISIIVFSFAVDFTALHLLDDHSFKIDSDNNHSFLSLFFNYLYMSSITFSSVGFGDITPVSALAKLAVMMEIGLRFFVLVFGIANINQIRVNK
jgi:hypothetical protein